MKIYLLMLVFYLLTTTVVSQNTTTEKFQTMQEIPRNSIALETNLIVALDLGYERLLPVKDHFGVIVGGAYTMGIGFGYGVHYVNAETLLVFGGPRHMFETGLIAFLDVGGDAGSGPGFKAGYRCQLKKGFLLKASLSIITFEDPPVLPMIGLGYSF